MSPPPPWIPPSSLPPPLLTLLRSARRGIYRLTPPSSPLPSSPLKDGARLSGPERDRMRVAVLDEASIVCSTLSFAGSQMFYRMTRKVRGRVDGGAGGRGAEKSWARRR